MNAQSVPLLILAGFVLSVGVYNLLVFIRRPRDREHFTFSVMCFLAGFYDFFCAMLYGISTPLEGAIWQRFQGAMLAFGLISFCWFVRDYFSSSVAYPRRTAVTLAAFSVILMTLGVLDLAGCGGFWNPLRQFVKTVRLPFGLSVVYHEVAPGPLSNAQSAVGFAAFGYLVGLAFRAYIGGAKREAATLLCAMAVVFISMVNDTAVSIGLYPFVYTLEYAYLAMVFMVANALTSKVVQTASTREALRASQDRFRGLVETTTDWIWEVNAAGIYTYCSPKVFDLLGYRPEEVVGKPVFEFMTPAESGRVREQFRIYAESRSPFERMENVNIRKDGGIVVLETSGVPILDARGDLAGYRGIDRDVTDRKLVDQDLRRRTRQLEALHQLGRELTAELDLDSLLRSVVWRAVALLGVSSGGIYLYDRDRDLIEWRLGVGAIEPPPGSSLRRGEGLPGMVWERNETLIVNEGEGGRKGARAPGDPPSAASVGSPVRWGEEFFGVLFVMSDSTSRSLDAGDAKLLDLFATQAAIALRNARLYEAARSRAERLSVVNRIASAVDTALELDELLDIVYREIAGIYAPDSFFIALHDEKTREIELRFRVEGGARIAPEKIPVGDGFTSRVLTEKKPLLITDLAHEEGGIEAGRSAQGKILRSWLGVPMLFLDKVIGVISLQSYGKAAYREDDEQLLSTIAEQVAAAVERARLYQILRDSEERYRTLFEQASDAVLLLSEDHRFLEVNERACQLLGYRRSELLSLSAEDIMPDGSPIVFPSRPDAAMDTVRTEGEYRRKDGTRVPVEESMALLEVAGRPVVFIIAHDITHRRRIEEQLRQAQKMEAIGTLAGGIAHDFNNILTGILGYASLMRQELPERSSLSADVEAIAGSAARAAELTRQLLTFSRRNPQVEMRPLDPNGVIREVASLLDRTIDKSITVDARLQDDVGTVMGNAGQLHQALLNLCLNARDAMPNGGLLRIETRNQGMAGFGGKGKVAICVSDSGIGMDAAVRSRLFEPFFTTKEKGRGLGLAMVYGIVRGHGGEIRVQSESGKGSSFEIILPASNLKPQALSHVDGQRADGGHETILVVDDEGSVRDVLQRILKRGGYSVIMAEDGIRGVEIYRERHREIDLVILDMAMPHMSGSETFESLIAIDPRVKVLISSGYSEEERAAELLKRGAKGFLSKPYGIDAIFAKIRETLGE